MTYDDDWAHEAAEQIVDQFCDIPVTRSGLMRASTIGEVKDIINGAFPIKDGAVMRVPRCDECKHWNRYVHTSAPFALGSCERRSDKAIAPILNTTPEFGCVEWETK